MASPQLENGYTRFANELLEQLYSLRIPGQELRIVLCVARKTYGFGKKNDMMSYGQIASETNIPRKRVADHVKALVERNILTVLNNGDRRPLTIGINKNYDKWQSVPKKGDIPNKGDRTVPKEGDRTVPNKGDHKRKKERKKIFSSDSIEIRLAKYLFNHIRKNNPAAKEPNFQTWASVVDLMIRRDERNPDEIKAVISWCQKDTFWMSNILSTTKLREKYDQLTMKMGVNRQGTQVGEFDPEEERRKLEEALS